MPPQNKKVYDEATLAAQKAAETLGGSYDPNKQGGFVITPEQLAKNKADAFVSPEQTLPPDISGLMGAIAPTEALSKPETDAQSISDRLLGLTTSLAGKGADTLTAEANAGLPELATQQKDLTSQLTGLINENKAIPLQIQQEFAGKGATRGGVAPIETARLRENAIKALSVNSLLEAVNGNIANARVTADRAVALKYAPIEAEQNALIKNLEIIQKSPAYTEAQKKRALQQSLLVEQQKQMTANKREDEQAIYALASMAMKNNPGNQQVQMAAQQAIASGDLKKAFTLVGQYQSDPMAVQAAILDNEYKRQQIATEKITQEKMRTAIEQKETITPTNSQDRIEQIDYLLKKTDDAYNMSGAAGRGLGTRIGEFFMGQTDYSNLEAVTNTLRANLMTMKTDADVRKFFGPQMSNSDVQFILSLGTSLNPEKQSPEKLREELDRIRMILAKSKNGISDKYGINLQPQILTIKTSTPITITQKDTNAILSKYGL